MRRLPLFLLLALVALSLTLAHGWWQVFQTKKALNAQLKQNQELIYRNAALQADIQDLKNGTDALQERARLQLGMIKRDEVFVQVMNQPTAVLPNSPNNPPAAITADHSPQTVAPTANPPATTAKKP